MQKSQFSINPPGGASATLVESAVAPSSTLCSMVVPTTRALALQGVFVPHSEVMDRQCLSTLPLLGSWCHPLPICPSGHHCSSSMTAHALAIGLGRQRGCQPTRWWDRSWWRGWGHCPMEWGSNTAGSKRGFCCTSFCQWARLAVMAMLQSCVSHVTFRRAIIEKHGRCLCFLFVFFHSFILKTLYRLYALRGF